MGATPTPAGFVVTGSSVFGSRIPTTPAEQYHAMYLVPMLGSVQDDPPIAIVRSTPLTVFTARSDPSLARGESRQIAQSPDRRARSRPANAVTWMSAGTAALAPTRAAPVSRSTIRSWSSTLLPRTYRSRCASTLRGEIHSADEPI